MKRAGVRVERAVDRAKNGYDYRTDSKLGKTDSRSNAGNKYRSSAPGNYTIADYRKDTRLGKTDSRTKDSRKVMNPELKYRKQAEQYMDKAKKYDEYVKEQNFVGPRDNTAYRQAQQQKINEQKAKKSKARAKVRRANRNLRNNGQRYDFK